MVEKLCMQADESSSCIVQTDDDDDDDDEMWENSNSSFSIDFILFLIGRWRSPLITATPGDIMQDRMSEVKLILYGMRELVM